MYNWYDQQIELDGNAKAKYDSDGYNFSVEAGHTFINQSKNSNRQWQFQPQVQLTYGSINSDAVNTMIANNALRVSKNRTDSLESRVGGRMTYLKDMNRLNQIQPFAEFNWHHQFEQQDITYNSMKIINDYPENRYEFKLGFEGNTSKNFNGWGNISYTFGEQKYQQVEAMAGIKYQW